MSHRWRLPSDVRTNAPLRVPTRSRTPLMSHFLLPGCLTYSRPTYCPGCLGPLGTAASVSMPELNCPVCEEKYALHIAPGEVAPHLVGAGLLHVVGMDRPVHVQLADNRDDWAQ